MLSKDDILTRYLNLVAFGNGAHGIQAAAQTCFGFGAVTAPVLAPRYTTGNGTFGAR